MPPVCQPIYRVKFEMNFQNTGPAVPGAKSEPKHEPAHLHCEYGTKVFKLFLDTWTTLPEKIQGKKGETKSVKHALEDLKPYREELLQMWKTKKVYKLNVHTTRKRADILERIIK